MAQNDERHQWDDSGERCLKCGDKDWFAGPKCEGRPILLSVKNDIEDGQKESGKAD